MANVKISQLPSFTGNTSGSWLVMNNSGETTTFKVQRETLLSGLQPSGNYATLSSNQFNGNQTITGSNPLATSLTVSGSIFSTNFIGAGPNASVYVSGSALNKNGLVNQYNDIHLSPASGYGVKITGSLSVSSGTTITGSLTASGSLHTILGDTRITSNIGTGSRNEIQAIGPFSINVLQSTGSGASNFIAARGGNDTINQIIAGTNFITSSVLTKMIGNTEITGTLIVNTPGYLQTLIYGDSVETNGGTVEAGQFNSNFSVNLQALGTNSNVNISAPFGTGSIRLNKSTRITGSLNVSGSDAFGWGITGTSLRSNGTLSVFTKGDTTGPYMSAFNSNEKMQLNFFGSGSLGESLIVLSPTSSLSPYNFSIKTTQTGSLINSSDGQLIQFPSGSKSVNITTVMNLAPQLTLPTGTTGSLAVSGSGLYFHNGTSWNLIS